MNSTRNAIKKILFAVSLFGTVSHAQQVSIEELAEQAASHYQAGSWTESVDSYKRLLDKQGENYLAWYRLAVSHNALGQGAAALSALSKANGGTQIPPNLIDYQFAVAFKHQQKLDQMWQKLEAAADSGYSNEQELVAAETWASLQKAPRFKTILDRVARNAHPCVYDDRFSQFDFWLGEWEVYGNTERSGPLYGRNSISKKEDGCLVMESWQGASGTTGTSMNYYDGTLDKWVQHWVSVGGVTINIEGGMVENSMIMLGKIYYQNGNEPKLRDFRAKWTPLKEGVVRQFFEESVDQGETWYPWFEGFYFPQEPANSE